MDTSKVKKIKDVQQIYFDHLMTKVALLAMVGRRSKELRSDMAKEKSILAGYAKAAQAIVYAMAHPLRNSDYEDFAAQLYRFKCLIDEYREHAPEAGTAAGMRVEKRIFDRYADKLEGWYDEMSELFEALAENYNMIGAAE